MAELQLETRVEGGVPSLFLTGELDADSSSPVRAALNTLLDCSQPLVFIHLTGLAYIDSAGLGILVSGLKNASARAGQVVLIQPSPYVSRILRITALDKVFQVFTDEGQARASLHRPASPISSP